MNLIKPKKLKTGDTVAIIAPAGAVDKTLISQAKTFFEKNGYKVKLGSNIFNKINYLSASDKKRIDDLHYAFKDPEIKAIICARGGYGALRLIKDIDYNLIRQNPKIFCGYSDISILNAMFLKKSSLITFSGPMAQSDFSNIIESTKQSFFNNTQVNKIEISLENAHINKDINGIIFGGNLSSLASLCGTDFIPDEQFIFIAEDINEPAYKLDRYFTQLLNVDKFRMNISAIMLGDFINIDNSEYFLSLQKNISQALNIPVINKFPISHSKSKSTIPIGAKAIIKNNKMTISDFLAE